MEFNGYRREDGRFGIRNEVLVISSVLCVGGVVDAIGRACADAVTIQHAYGCGYGPDDFVTSYRTLTGIINNPNVGAVLVVGLGCELLKAEFLAQAAKNKPVEALEVQKSGSAAAVRKGVEVVEKFLQHTGTLKRERSPVSTLIVGLKCGGSDAFSGVTANPAVGAASDMLIGEGASVIMGETTEMFGTAHILEKRCAGGDVGTRVRDLVRGQEEFVRKHLGELAGLVISPGNFDGGLSSILEKSLGCIAKGGTTPIREVVEYAAAPAEKGLIIMNTTGYDIDDMAAMAAGGAQIILFTTGRGTPAGFPAVPVVKISSNTATFTAMAGDIDINAGTMLDEGKTVNDAGREIFEKVMAVANGELTRAEINRSRVFSCLKQGPSF
jgi:altronate dehydratase large subunit